MARYNFNNKEIVNEMRSPAIYEYNMAENLALLSNDPHVIRRFFQLQVPKYFRDSWLADEASNKFMAQNLTGQAFAYFGIIPMIVKAKVNLVASNGFICKSNNEEIDKVINRLTEETDLFQKFRDGVYWESGIGDVAFRVSYCPDVSNKPIIDLIEPQNIEVNYEQGKIKSFVIKEISEDDPAYELREIHYKDEEGFVNIDYRFTVGGNYVDPNDEALIMECKAKFSSDINITPLKLPLKDYLVIFKKNDNTNSLYNNERGVPDIQGLASIEDALTECISDLSDAIRMGGIKEYVSDKLIPQDEDGNDLPLNPFNKTIVTANCGPACGDGTALRKVVQGDIKWDAYTKTIQNLTSIAINKAGLSPATLGLTGIECIGSSAERQADSEKPSMRTREIALNGWRKTLKDLLNRYIQVQDYINGKDVIDYSEQINITFNEYTNPTAENITDLLVKQVQGGIKSPLAAIKELNKGLSREQAENELLQILASHNNSAAGGNG